MIRWMKWQIYGKNINVLDEKILSKHKQKKYLEVQIGGKKHRMEVLK